MKKVLITGGAGFIGAWLGRALLDQGVEVVALDDLSTGTWPNPTLGEPEGLTFVRGDCADAALVARLVEGCDFVFHLAAVVGVRRVVESPLRTALVNQATTLTVLEAAAAAGVPVLLASSSEVYGPLATAPFREDDAGSFGPPEQGRWTYALTKAAGEQMAFALGRERGLPFVVVRLFNTVGPGQSAAFGMVLPRFVDQARRGEPMTVYGDGEQTRVFCHVADVVDALVALARTPSSWGRLYNVGGVQSVSIRDLAGKVRERLGSDSPIRHVPFVQAFGDDFAEARHRQPDIGRIAQAVGWSPRRGLDRIIDDAIESAGAGAPAPPREHERGEA
ncbi:NAD-dependent epimerase/dehydratase family protein [Caulobacter sp. CCNWLY153]|uniref:NAD-dependent epimerase/dehydratase family protein n=1 Tax=unclassified Caulobacter TaxID=2648921 RepID=UPI002FEF0091